jgi:hypothetical protein
MSNEKAFPTGTGEPVAWMYQEYRDDDQFGWRDEIQFVQPPNDPNYFRNIVPVYTTPLRRTWVGLSEDELERLIHNFGNDPHTLLDEVDARLRNRNT